MSSVVLSRMGDSVGIVIPKELCGTTFQQGDHVRIERRGNSLVITPASRPMTLQSFMQGYEGPGPEPIDVGAPMGREAW